MERHDSVDVDEWLRGGERRAVIGSRLSVGGRERDGGGAVF